MKTTLEKVQVTDDLVYKVQISTNEEVLYLHVDFMSGRFVVEKSFRNNYEGIESLKKTVNILDTEEKVISYLKIGNVKGVGNNND